MRGETEGHEVTPEVSLNSSIDDSRVTLQGFSAHNGEILAAVSASAVGSIGSIIITGGHDWQVCLSLQLCLNA